MGRHRLEPTRVRPRYGRVAAAALSLVVTMVALLGGLGILPIESSRSPAEQASDASGTHAGVTASASGADASGSSSAASSADAARSAQPDALPADSGDGRRVVFSEGSQRVWLVDADGAVTSTYLVSGSVTDNLQTGRYHVYSRSRWAVGVEDSGVMQYFVRFAHGPNAAIGFHSIPTRSGTPLQTEAQLGTPQSHGCIRQKLSDAQRMWDFADVGTDVVVVA